MILDIKDISISFGGVKALSNCSMSIKEGKITAIVGPNGSGKTTLFNCINSIYVPDEGSIVFENRDITKLVPHKISKMGISRTFQQVRIFENLSIRDHIEIAMSSDDEAFFKSFFRRKKDRTKEIEKFLNLTGLNKPLDTLLSDLSYGQRKLLDLTIALAKPHDILMLDEPVAGVNPKLRKQIKELLIKLREKGETILVIEHNMPFVMGIAQEVIVMNAGEVLARGTPKEVLSNERVLEAYLGD